MNSLPCGAISVIVWKTNRLEKQPLQGRTNTFLMSLLYLDSIQTLFEKLNFLTRVEGVCYI